MGTYTDFDQIHPGLFQGSYPKLTKELMQQFDVVVYCAMEKQPKAADLKLVPRGKHVVGIPLDDDSHQPITREQAAYMIKLARQLATHVRAGSRVLVTCAMGLNRSGIVTALTLMAVTGCPGPAAVGVVRQRRRPASDGTRALFNPIFARFVASSPPLA